MARDLINNKVRVVVPADYQAGQAANKVAFLKEKTKQIIETRIVDVLKVKSLISSFITSPVLYGDGWRNMTLGLADVEEYTSNPDAKYPENHKYLADYVEEFSKDIKDKIRVTVNERELSRYFSNATEVERLINLVSKTIEDTWAIRNNEFIKTLFDYQGDFHALKKTNPLYLEAEAWRNRITNEHQYNVAQGQNDQVEHVAKVKELIKDMTIEASDKYHLDNTITGFPVGVTSDDLIWVVSYKDLLEFTKYASSDVRNPDLFKLPNVQIIELNIPQGTSYLLHKESVQIAPQLNENLHEFNVHTLTADIVSHLQWKVGLSSILPFIKISKA